MRENECAFNSYITNNTEVHKRQVATASTTTRGSSPHGRLSLLELGFFALSETVANVFNSLVVTE